jgi:hypothetical protein
MVRFKNILERINQARESEGEEEVDHGLPRFGLAFFPDLVVPESIE